ncbi:GNAT family N-acetyltransferase [Maribacter sp. 4G9]|uniref:GNAT family N-acetyltransferase n=1 Tax=Maribacter sp. 4G9 TaxID=1889777 RepID=UPI00197F4EB2|nr:GNAT family N-acetyltransferase [Maribacter sp. 4G9]
MATITDLDLLTHWDTKQHVMDCDPNDDDWSWEIELNRNPEWREQLIAEVNGKPVGVVQIIDPYKEETRYWGTVGQNKRAIDIWIGEDEDLNRGYGTQMMKLAIARCYENRMVNGVLVDPLKSNRKAHRFYERLGFEFIGERKFDDSICCVYELKRKSKT